MTTVRTQCPQCAAKIRLPAARANGRRIKCPRCQHAFVPKQLPTSRTQAASPEPTGSEAGIHNPAIPVTQVPAPTAAQDIPLIVTDTSRHVRRRRRSPSSAVAVVAGLALLPGIVLGAWWFLLDDSDPVVVARPNTPPKQAVEQQPEETLAEERPLASVDRIPFEFLPVVPQLLLHLHPAELWGGKAEHREFAGTLGDLGLWLRTTIQQATRFSPEEIEELTIAVSFGARGDTPDLAFVVRLRDARTESDLLQQHIQGELIEGLNGDVIESGGYAWLIADGQTVVLASLALAADLAESRDYPAVPSADMELLLKTSDRNHHVTILSDLGVLDTHKDLLLIDQLRALGDAVMLRLRPGARMLGFSMHLESYLKIQTSLIPDAESSAGQLGRRITRQLHELPPQLAELVRRLQPRTMGHRRLIARFPAMVEGVRLGTRVGAANGVTRFTTILPAHAASSLAAGAMLTWNETVLSPRELPTPTTRRHSAEPLRQQLQRQVLVDFRREPLQSVIQFLGESLEIDIVVDGDALKLAGFTRNLPQTHNLGRVTVLAALDAIMSQYDGAMVLIHDEAGNRLIVSTRDAASEQGQTVLPTR